MILQLTFGYIHSATDTKQPVVTHGFLGAEEEYRPPTPSHQPSPPRGGGGGVKLARSFSYRYRAPLLRLAASFVNNRCRAKRRRSEGGGGSQPPLHLEEELHGFCGSACGRA